MMKIGIVTVRDDVEARGCLLEAGSYHVEMPEHYDPAQVTGEDILLDYALRKVGPAADALCESCGREIGTGSNSLGVWVCDACWKAEEDAADAASDDYEDA